MDYIISVQRNHPVVLECQKQIPSSEQEYAEFFDCFMYTLEE